MGTRTRRVPMTGNVPNETGNTIRIPRLARNKVCAPVPIRGEAVDGLNCAGRGEAYNREAGLSRQLRSKEMGRSPKVGSNPASPPFHYHFAITGQLPSGKNQVQMLWRRGNIQRVPNKTFTNWRAAAGLQLLAQPRPTLPLSAPITLIVDWPGNRIVRDVSGQTDALFSLLVHMHILKNDGLVYDLTWRRHALNRKFPKVVMEIQSWE